MSLKETLKSKMIETLKSKSSLGPVQLHFAEIRLITLRAAMGAITETETSGKTRSELDDAGVITVLRKMVKQRDDSARIYGEARETERQLREMFEIEVLNEFLPQQLDETATRELVSGIISEKGLEGPRAIGQVMGSLKGRSDVDTGMASKIAREILVG